MPVTVTIADITQLAMDAIVNAANPGLLGGGGVDGAIHRAAGAALLQACRTLPQIQPAIRCPTGEARITPGFCLPARYVIHVVGPVWQDGEHGEPGLLASCYRQALHLLRAHHLQRIAFPAISCGIYGYPPARAAAVAARTLEDELRHDASRDVVLCCHSEEMRAIFQHAVNAA